MYISYSTESLTKDPAVDGIFYITLDGFHQSASNPLAEGAGLIMWDLSQARNVREPKTPVK